ncbi:unnamed protein product [Diamesa tonsa]
MESEKILKTIKYDNQPKGEAVNYLYKLRSLKVDQLKKEQTSLQDEIKNLEYQTFELAVSNYPNFIKTAENSRQVHRGWNTTSENLQDLTKKVPDFSNKCDEFLKKTLEIQQNSRANTLTLKNHHELLEILELPQLMESSIREEKYEDALELAAYVQRLGSKFTNVPVVNNLLKTIEFSWHVMITQLLSELKCDLQLQKCLSILGFLRRMQAFSSPELKLKFLQKRDCWFKEILAAIPKTDPLQHLVKVIEVSRINLFNIVTQYKAIFDCDGKDGNSKMNMIFNSWMHEKIEEFLKILESDLLQSNCSLTEISSVLGQCMYFGLSFSRIGVDFRALMVPIFLRVIGKNLNSGILKVTKQFELDMDNYTLINRDVSMKKYQIQSETDGESKGNAPPESLLDFQPLATYLNGILIIFNELKVCSPIAIGHLLVSAMNTSLEGVGKSILSFYHNEQQAFGMKEKDFFLKLCSCFAFEMLPFIQNCIKLIFPQHSRSLVQQMDSITTLQNETILKPIEKLLL